MVKKCSHCGIEKPLDDFFKDKNTPTGRAYRCKPCNSLYAKSMRERHMGHGVVVTEKHCFQCGVTRPASEFYKCPGSTTGLRPECIPCAKKAMIADRDKHRERQRKNRATNAERYYIKGRTKHLSRKFGMTQDVYDVMLASQDALCAICKKPSEKVLCIDHDHETGEIRALLCDLCNRGLGYFRDDATVLQQAISYLARYKGK